MVGIRVFSKEDISLIFVEVDIWMCYAYAMIATAFALDLEGLKRESKKEGNYLLPTFANAMACAVLTFTL